MKLLYIVTIGLFLFTGCKSGAKSSSNGLNPNRHRVVLSAVLKDEYLNIINQARSRNQTCGSRGYFTATTSLRWSDKLYSSAYEHSYDMATSNTFSHEGSGEVSDLTGVREGGKSIVPERLESYGYKWNRYAENIGAGTDIDTAEKIVSQLLASDGHCANIMNPLLKEVGMAMVKNSNTKYVYYWTQNFGTPPN